MITRRNILGTVLPKQGRGQKHEPNISFLSYETLKSLVLIYLNLVAMIFQAGFRFKFPNSQGYLSTLLYEEKILMKK
jgi:hypothetical protein